MLPTLSRIQCPQCGAECLEAEISCWQCGANLRPKPAPPPEEANPADSAPIKFDGLIQLADSAPQTMTTLTGETVEVDSPSTSQPAATIGDTRLIAQPEEPVMVLSFCRACGFQNEEGVRECVKCKNLLEVIKSSEWKEMEALPRAWGFDVLGLAWIVLGVAAIFAGQFLLQATPGKTTWADYFWTGIVVCAPGIMIFMRHVACKIIFWAMTFASILVWLVIGFIWQFVGLQLTPNSEVGLSWLALLSALSAISYFTVRTNDAFDWSID